MSRSGLILCMSIYDRRRVPDVPRGTIPLVCQFPEGHEGDHSWAEIKRSDLLGVIEQEDQCETCGHTAFEHAYGPVAKCQVNGCRCLKFVAPPPPPEPEPEVPNGEEVADWMASHIRPLSETLAEAVVEAIDAGDMDRYLEVLLAAAHDRKRAMRGTFGFPRYRS